MMPNYWCPLISKAAAGMNPYQQQGQMIPGQMPPGQLPPCTMYPGIMQPLPQQYQGQEIYMFPETDIACLTGHK